MMARRARLLHGFIRETDAACAQSAEQSLKAIMLVCFAPDTPPDDLWTPWQPAQEQLSELQRQVARIADLEREVCVLESEKARWSEGARSNLSDLVLPLKKDYFEAIRDGCKVEEYRLCNDYWFKRLSGKEFRNVVLTLGYPKSGDESRRIVRPWQGYVVKTILHPHFGPQPVEVYAINVKQSTAE